MRSAAGLEADAERAGPPAAALALGGLASLAVALALLVWGPPPVRPLGVAALGLALAIVGLTVAFSYRSELYIPARFGVRRLFDYSSVPFVLLALGLAEWALASLLRFGRWLPPAVALVVAVAVAVPLLPKAGLPQARLDRARAVGASLDRLASLLPCDARLLANQQTEGVFQAYLGRVQALEGMTPYLRPEILEDVVRRFLRARAFFRDPRDTGPALLRDLEVSHVVVIRRAGIGYPATIGKTDLDGLRAAPFLEAIHEDDAFVVFRVRTDAPAGPTADPDEFPGYDCRRPLTVAALHSAGSRP